MASPVGFAASTGQQSRQLAQSPFQPPMVIVSQPPKAAVVRRGLSPSEVAEKLKDGTRKAFERGKRAAAAGIDDIKVKAAEDVETYEMIMEGSSYGHALVFGVLDSVVPDYVVGDDEATPETEGIGLSLSLPIAILERIGAAFIDDPATAAALRGGGVVGISISLYSITRQVGAKAAAELGE